MADMTLADLLAAPAGNGAVDWNGGPWETYQSGRTDQRELRNLLALEAFKRRMAGMEAAEAPPAPELLLQSPQAGAVPQPLPVEGLRLPQPRAAMDPVGEGVSLADWIAFQGWAPARTAQQPGDPYQGPIPPIPADRIDRAKQAEPAPEPAKKPAKKPAKRREEPRAKPRATTKTARSKSGKTFVVGKIYTNAQGQRFRFRADGSFEKVK